MSHQGPEFRDQNPEAILDDEDLRMGTINNAVFILDQKTTQIQPEQITARDSNVVPFDRSSATAVALEHVRQVRRIAEEPSEVRQEESSVVFIGNDGDMSYIEQDEQAA